MPLEPPVTSAALFGLRHSRHPTVPTRAPARAYDARRCSACSLPAGAARRPRCSRAAAAMTATGETPRLAPRAARLRLPRRRGPEPRAGPRQRDRPGPGRLARRARPARRREPLPLRRLHRRARADHRRRGRHLRRAEERQGPRDRPVPGPDRVASRPRPPSAPRATADDPDAAKVVYVSDVPLDKPGEWTFAALIKEGDGFTGDSRPDPEPGRRVRPRRRRRQGADASRPRPPTTSPTSPRSTPASRPAPCTTRTSPTCSARSPSSCSSRPRRSARAASAARSSTSPSRSSATPRSTARRRLHPPGDLQRQRHQQGHPPAGQGLPAAERAVAVRDRPRREGHAP